VEGIHCGKESNSICYPDNEVVYLYTCDIEDEANVYSSFLGSNHIQNDLEEQRAWNVSACHDSVFMNAYDTRGQQIYYVLPQTAENQSRVLISVRY